MLGLSSLRRAAAKGAVVAGLAALSAAWVQSSGGLLPTTLRDFRLPGTQPNSLNVDLFSVALCAGCHGGYDETVEPYRRWSASLMAQATRDPIFHAALAIAEQDADFAGDLCLRCHSPNGWLNGRSVPTDGSALDPLQNDFEGVACHFCHRLVDPVLDPANPSEDASILAALTLPPGADAHSGQYVVDPEDRRRGPFDLGQNFPYHQWRQSPHHRESQLCATCHDVSNPALVKQLDGTYKTETTNTPHPTFARDDMFPIERTFSEWRLSVFAQAELETGGRFGGNKTAVATCQDCHMPDATGTACLPGLGGAVRSDLPLHEFNGANSWVLRAVRQLYPDSETGLSAAAVDDAVARNVSMLRRSADLSATVRGADVVVRVVNRTGHKLPTGYGEGRRMWLNVRWFDAAGAELAAEERGHYDPVAADLTESDTRVWEIVHGLDDHMAQLTGIAAGPSFHFVLNNVTLLDNRIPPRGFEPTAFEDAGAGVVGHHYDTEQYWDEVSFDAPAGAARAEVRLFHQTTAREYIEFLRNENTTNATGDQAWALWDMFGKSAPVEMALADVDLAQPPCLVPLAYGLGKETSLGERAELSANGPASATAGGFALQVEKGVPGTLGVAFWSAAPRTSPYAGGTLLVQTPLGRSAIFTLDAQGEHTLPVPVTPAMVGTERYYQVIFRDPAGSFGLGLTNGLFVEFCD